MRLVILAAGRGSRLAAESNGRAKVLLDIAGRSILDRAVELAGLLGLSPLVVTRPEYAAEIGRTAEVLVEPEPTGIMDTLYYARSVLAETFCWIGGDTVFSDLAPIRELFLAHRREGSIGSFLYCRTDRFKTKLAFGPPPRVQVTREGAHEWSLPNFGMHEPRLFADMAGRPRSRFVQAALDRGEPVLFHPYTAPVFEVDTPEDLAAARRFFGRPSEEP
jgi:choline kinase